MSGVGAFTGGSVGHRAPSTLAVLPLPPAPRGGAVPSAPTRRRGDFPRKTNTRFLHAWHVTPSPEQTKRGEGPLVAPGQLQDRSPGVWPGPRHATAPSLTARCRLRSSSPRRMQAARRELPTALSSSALLANCGTGIVQSPAPRNSNLWHGGSAALSCPRNAATPAVSPFDPSTGTRSQTRAKRSCCRFALMSAPAQPAPVTAA